MATSLVFADDYWDDGWRGPSVIRLRDGRVASHSPAIAAAHQTADIELRMSGAVFPGIYDRHVHLGLIEPETLFANGVSRVRDLGWDPQVAAGWLNGSGCPKEAESTAVPLPDTEIVGAFLTCTGGYPSDRSWAARTSVCTVDNAERAAQGVAAQLAVGATAIKVTLNADAGPVPDAETVLAIVRAAHAAGVVVVAHVQGAGQVEKALSAGVDELAHVPWTERVPEDLIDAMAEGMSWISTLDIHGWGDYGLDFEIAASNARRFVARGGRLRYGTDLGNGPLPVGVNERELQALAAIGLNADQLARATFAPAADSRPMWIPGRRPTAGDDFARWLTTARPLPEPQP